MTNEEAVAKVVNSFRLDNKDERISRRYVLNLLRDVAANLISQKLLDRTLSKELNLYTKIRCFEFEKIEVVKCDIIEFRQCRTIMRSILPLPKIVSSRFGLGIKDVTAVDGVAEFNIVTPQQYRTNKKRKYSLPDEVYMYVDSDNHAYILDQEIYAVDLTVLTLETESEDNCSSCSNDNSCKSIWDYDFIVPDKLEQVVFKETLQILSQTYKQIIPDQNPNNVEKS
jgi:hypothetical protein